MSGVCEDLLLQLQANPQDRELRTRLATCTGLPLQLSPSLPASLARVATGGIPDLQTPHVFQIFDVMNLKTLSD